MSRNKEQLIKVLLLVSAMAVVYILIPYQIKDFLDSPRGLTVIKQAMWKSLTATGLLILFSLFIKKVFFKLKRRVLRYEARLIREEEELETKK